MDLWGAIRRETVAKFLLLPCIAAFPLRASAQSQEVTIRATGETVPVCKPGDLDANVTFFSSGTDFIVGFNLQNISADPCAADPPVAFPQFAPDAKPFGLCTDCEDRLPNGQYPIHDPVVLDSGGIAHQTYRWKTVASADAPVACQPLAALFTPVLVVAPTLFKKVCSEIAVSRVYPGEFVPPVTNDQPNAAEAHRDEMFVLSSRSSRYYKDEMFTLLVGLEDSVTGPPSGTQCPTLFLRERSPDGTTRFDEVRPRGFKTCKTFTLGADRDVDWQSGFEVDSGVNSRWEGIGEHSFELFQPVDSSPDGTIQFVRSNKLTVQIDDPALIARKWQGKAHGVGVDVTLDKDTYKLGEDVPLHIATENFDAPVPVYAISPLWDPGPAIGVEVRDVTGRRLSEGERVSSQVVWMGHGLGLFPYDPGKLVTIERTLAAQGWLPNSPGVYIVVVSWCTFDGTSLQPDARHIWPEGLKPYATVQGTAMFRIIADPPPGAQARPY
jgi:hypothetical protein